MADDTLIDHMQFAVAARAGDGASVENLVASLEQRHLAANCLDHAGHVPAQHFRGPVFRRHILPHLGVDRVDRNGFDLHQQVARAGYWLRQIDVFQ